MLMVFLLGFAWSGLAVQAQSEDSSADEFPAWPGMTRYAYIRIDGLLPETLPPVYLFEARIDTLYDVLQRIEQAGDDASVQGLLLDVGPLQAGLAKVQELRSSLLKFRGKGKEVVCFLEGADNLTYYLATAADRVVMIASGSLMLTGLRAEVLFFRGLMDKLGVEADLIQIGPYKGAAEPFTRSESSAAFRESLGSLLDDYYRQLCEDIGRARGIDAQLVMKLIDNGPYSAREAKKAGLVDELMFRDELLQSLNRKSKGELVLEESYGKKKPQKAALPAVGELLKRFMLGVAPQRTAASPDPCIAVIYAVGPIIQGGDEDSLMGEGVIASLRIVSWIRRAANRDNVRAIVLRIESPGGSAVASDAIWREIRLADQVKPVIVSLSDVAGSGGYYIASAGRIILADPGTITGSIGVVGGKFVLSGLYEKLGLNVDVFQRGKHAGLLSSAQRFSESERSRLRELLEHTYETFLKRVAEARGLPVAQIEQFSEGRPWTGAQAKENLLVDRLGGLEDAIEVAKVEAGMEPDAPVSVVRWPEARSLFEILLWGKPDEVQAPALRLTRALPADVRRLYNAVGALRCFDKDPVAFLMPAVIFLR